MSGQLQVSSSPAGEPSDTMSTDSIRIPGEESEIPDSSQMELVDLPVEVSNSRRNKGKRPDYRECCNSDSETQDAAGEASIESEDAAEDIPARIMAPRVTTRSRAKKEAGNPGRATINTASHPNTAKRSHDDHESETTKPAKRGRPAAANTQIKKLEKDAYALVDRFTSKFRELETTRSENQELKKEIKLLKRALEEEQADRMQTELAQDEDIIRLESECKRWKIRLESAIDEAKKDSSKYVKVPDSDIEYRWNMLAFNIRSMVSQCLTQRPIEQNDMLEFLLRALERPLPQFEYELIMLRSHILRRTIWYFLMIGVFGGEYPIWHGDSGRTLTKFLAVQNEGHLEDIQHLQIISQIKSRAIAEIDGEIQLNDEAMNELIGTATMAVEDFIPNFTENSVSEATDEVIPDPAKEFQLLLRGLVAEAAGLHTIMMKSKAIFLVQWIGDADGETLSLYDPENMAPSLYGIAGDASRSVVKFVEAPALVKIGNADGQDFHQRMTLCKSHVVVEEQEIDEPMENTPSSFLSDSEDGGEDSKKRYSLSPSLEEESKDV